MMDQQQQAQAMRSALAESGGDVEKAVELMVRTGNVKAAHELAPLAKMAQERRQAEETRKGLSAIQQPEAPAGQPMEVGDGKLIRTAGEDQAAGNPRQARIDALNKMAALYANNPVVMQRLQAEIDKLQNVKPMIEHNFSVGDNQVQPHISYDEGRNWQPIPGSKPSAKFAKMVADDGPSPTADTLEIDAWRYLTDGTLPPNMGRGQQGAGHATQIRNRAAELAKSMDMAPDEIRMAQLTNKTQVQAIGQLAKAKAQILQFEKTANMNADLALQASEKVDRTGVPVLNRWVQAGRTAIGGDVEASRFHAATETFVSEYAKVMSGGYGAAATTEGAQNRAHTLLNTANTKDQFRGVVGQLKAEMENRVKALNGQMEEERGNLRRGIRPNAPGAAPAAPVAAPQVAPAGGAYSDAEKERRYQEWKARQPK
jgi:hypothetical protein